MVGGNITTKTPQIISALELRQLVIRIKEHRQDIGIRFRFLGQLWQERFCRIITVTDNRVLVNDELANQLISVDFSNVVQFEIDNRFQNYEPHFHYEVSPYAVT